jgi:hypothetical protein
VPPEFARVYLSVVIEAEPYTCRVAQPDIPGEFCFPPLAALITGAARLMLALLERSAADLGGTYAMEDTDSMAIVATEHGGIVQCPGGREQTKKKQPGSMALSWAYVDKIISRCEAMNLRQPPGSERAYARDAVPGFHG